MHKMPELPFLSTEMLTLCMATSTLLKFSRQLSLLVGYRRNLSRTFIRHRRKSAGEGR